jgi:phenylacetate-CoA ligase
LWRLRYHADPQSLPMPLSDSQQIPSGIVWPSVPPAPDTGLLTLLFQLEQTQWWSPERLRESQLKQLRALLRHAYTHSVFHRERMRVRDFDPFADFSWEDFSGLPCLTRAELQANLELLDGRAGLTGHGDCLPGASSGSTGRPIRFFSTAVTRLMWRAITLRDHLWHRRDMSLKLASIGDFGSEVNLPDWGNPAASVTHTGPAAVMSIEENSARQLDWLQQQQPGYILTYPTNLDALLRLSRERGIRLPQLREARTIAETLPTTLRGFCREVWGVPLTDIYSSREAGYIALQCPEGTQYHVQSENVVVEILDQNGRACGPDEDGKVVLTVLNNFATPLIRYEIGDIAAFGAACACGRGMPVLERVAGRVRNLLTLPDGEQRFPDFGVDFYGDIAPVTQFQVIQKTPQRLELHAVAGRKPTAAEEAAIKQRLNSQLMHEFEIDLVLRDAISRGPGGKYEEFRSEVVAPAKPE